MSVLTKKRQSNENPRLFSFCGNQPSYLYTLSTLLSINKLILWISRAGEMRADSVMCFYYFHYNLKNSRRKSNYCSLLSIEFEYACEDSHHRRRKRMQLCRSTVRFQRERLYLHTGCNCIRSVNSFV